MNEAVTLRLTPANLACVTAPALHPDRHAHLLRACHLAGFFYQAHPAPANYGSPDAVPTLTRELKKAGFTALLSEGLQEWHRAKQQAQHRWKAELGWRVDEMKARGLEMRPYQIEDAQELRKRQAVLLALEQRVGKLVSSAAALDSDCRCLVVARKNDKRGWVRGLNQWRPDLRVTVLKHERDFRYPEPGEVAVTHYEALPKPVNSPSGKTKVARLPKGLPSGMVLISDESHYLRKGQVTRYGKVFRALAKAAMAAKGKVWLLTGTPCDKPPELWKILEMASLGKAAYGSWPVFCAEMGAVEGPFSIEWTGIPTDRGVEMLRKVMIRRTRADAMPWLPPKTWEEVPVDIEHGAAKLLDSTNVLLKGVDDDAVLQVLNRGASLGRSFETISKAMTAVAVAKIPFMLQEVEDAEAADEPLVVWSAHIAPIEALRGRPGWGVVTGSDSAAQRDRAITAFQEGRLRGLGVSIMAGNTMHDFSRAWTCLFVDRSWSPRENAQAEDRHVGYAQTQPVLIRTLVGDHELERRLYQILLTKQQTANALIDGVRA